MYKEGSLNKEEFEQLMKVKEEALAEVKIEIDAYNEADLKTFEKHLEVIKLLSSIGNYMSKPGSELEKVRLAKVMLLNPKLRGGTIEYDYQKPFNVLSQLTSEKNWWT